MLSTLATTALRRLPPETAHKLALRALAAGMAPKAPPPTDPRLATSLWGLNAPSPIGVAAGFDKNAEAPDALLAMGAGFVEIGAVTPKPQIGNPKPRLFRLTEDRAVINRMGFNNEGLDAVRARLRARVGRPGIVGANLGANKDAADRMADYETVLRGLWGLCAFYTVNVSSPNTEKLRDLQGPEALAALLKRVLEARDALAAESGRSAPVLVKIAPDLADAEIDAIAEVCLAVGVDGVVATNTTLARPDTLKSRHAPEKGGLSGAPLFARSTGVLRRFRRRLGDQIPLIGVGGVETAEQAYEKMRSGASLVQLYTGLVFGGPRLLSKLSSDLSILLEKDGFERAADAVGVDV